MVYLHQYQHLPIEKTGPCWTLVYQMYHLNISNNEKISWLHEKESLKKDNLEQFPYIHVTMEKIINTYPSQLTKVAVLDSVLIKVNLPSPS